MTSKKALNYLNDMAHGRDFGNDKDYAQEFYEIVRKELNSYKDIEKKIGFDLIKLFKMLFENGYIYEKKDNKIYKVCVRGINADGIIAIDQLCSYPECDYLLYYSQYGKDWAFTREELNK